MRGHEQILAMRRRGVAPKFVFINDYPCATDWIEFRENATVCVFGDGIESLDFRFLVGLRVSISATSETRAKSLFSMAKAAGATAVAACHLNHDQPTWGQTGWAEIWHLPEPVVEQKLEEEIA